MNHWNAGRVAASGGGNALRRWGEGAWGYGGVDSGHGTLHCRAARHQHCLHCFPTKVSQLLAKFTNLAEFSDRVGWSESGGSERCLPWGDGEARAARTQVTTSTATKRDTESCGQPKGHKPTGELGVAAARAGAAGGGAAPLARQGTPPTTPVPPPPRRRRANTGRRRPHPLYSSTISTYTSNFPESDFSTIVTALNLYNIPNP